MLTIGVTKAENEIETVDRIGSSVKVCLQTLAPNPSDLQVWMHLNETEWMLAIRESSNGIWSESKRLQRAETNGAQREFRLAADLLIWTIFIRMKRGSPGCE